MVLFWRFCFVLLFCFFFCFSLHFLVNEVHVCRLALSLPCLEPFTPERILTLSDVSVAALLCATAQVQSRIRNKYRTKKFLLNVYT